jgi:hypothetical protein
MKISAVTVVIGFSLFATVIFGLAQKTPTVEGKNRPVITLRVRPEECDIPRNNGRILFDIDASASEGFNGTVSGTITVPQAVNPDQVDLIEGANSKEFHFKLAAGQKMSDTQAYENRTYVVQTSPTNPTNGTLVWPVTVDPSAQYETANSPLIVKFSVVTGLGQ